MSSGSGQAWIDTSVTKAIDYFAGMTGSFLTIALKLAQILAICGILWSCIQLVFGTMENRKFIVGCITKWFFFLFCMYFFPVATRALQKFAIEVGTDASAISVASIEESLGEYYEGLEKLVEEEEAAWKTEEEAIAERIARLQEVTAKKEEQQKRANNYNYGGYVEADYARNAMTKVEQEQQELEDRIQAAIDNPKGSRKFLNALESILIITTEDGSSYNHTTGSGKQNVVKKYQMDLFMTDADGNKTTYLSPSAILKLNLLSAQIMWENEWNYDVVATWAEDAGIKKNEDGTLKKQPGFRQLKDFPARKIFNIILCFICEIMIIVVTAAILIQYIMCIIEYAITTSFSLLLLPCMLFDGLKDMSNKIIPSLLAQAIKLSMIILCMYFCTYTFIDLAVHIATNTSDFSIAEFAYVLFTIILTFALTSNAPKLAVTLLNGQPQMSMGEFVTAAGAMAGGAKLAANKVAQANEVRKAATAKGVQFAANRAGDVVAMAAGAKAAKTSAAGQYATDGEQFKAGLMGAGAVMKARTANRVRAKANEQARYGGSVKDAVGALLGINGSRGGGSGGFGGGSGGAGVNRFGSTNPDWVARKRTKDDNPNQYSSSWASSVQENGTQDTMGEYLGKQAVSGANIGASAFENSKFIKKIENRVRERVERAMEEDAWENWSPAAACADWYN